jgi:hypothetical protein
LVRSEKAMSYLLAGVVCWCPTLSTASIPKPQQIGDGIGYSRKRTGGPMSKQKNKVVITDARGIPVASILYNSINDVAIARLDNLGRSTIQYNTAVLG